MALTASTLLKHILPVLLALFLSPLPKKLGFYEYLFSGIPLMVGMLPCQIPSTDTWGFTMEDLYGDGDINDPETIETYRTRLRGQTALVTGANSGLGYEISLALARLGANVVLACRNRVKCIRAAAKILNDDSVRERNSIGGMPRITTKPVELSSLKSVREFCKGFLAGENNQLDMIFFNAGIVDAPPNEDGSTAVTEDGIEKVFATNVVGHHLLYKLLVEQQREATNKRKTPMRIVLTSSALSYGTKHPFKVPTDLDQLNKIPPLDGMTHYAQSKFAQVLWVQEATARLDALGNGGGNNNKEKDPSAVVYANAAHPGAVATNIQYKKKASQVSEFFRRLIFWPAAEGALTLLYLGTAIQDLQEQNIRGQYFHPQTRWIRDHRDASAKDPETKILREKLWIFLDELVADFV